jgi:hypothetical protein
MFTRSYGNYIVSLVCRIGVVFCPLGCVFNLYWRVIAKVLKIDRLKVFMVPFFPHVLLVCNEEVNMS